MVSRPRTVLGLPFPTNPSDQTKPTMLRGGSDAYQMLPDPVLAVRTPLVVLDWSTNCYHRADLAWILPRGCFTNHYHRGERQGIKPNAPFRVGEYRRGGCHMGNVVEGYVLLEWWYTLRRCRHHGGGYRKEKSFLIRPVGL